MVAAVAGLTDDVVAAVLGSAAGVPSVLAATVGWQLAGVVPPGEVVPVVEPQIGGVVIDAIVVGVRLAAPAIPVNPETATSEVTAIPDPMINLLAHISFALLSVEAQSLFVPLVVAHSTAAHNPFIP